MGSVWTYGKRVTLRALWETWQYIGSTLGIFALSTTTLSFYLSYEWYGLDAMLDEIHSWGTIATATAISGAMVFAYNMLAAAVGIDNEIRNERDALAKEVSERIGKNDLSLRCEHLAREMADFLAQTQLNAPPLNLAQALLEKYMLALPPCLRE